LNIYKDIDNKRGTKEKKGVTKAQHNKEKVSVKGG